MDYQEAIRRLLNHANLSSDDLPDEESFLWTLWRMEHIRTPQDFDPLYRDVLSCMVAVNLTLNGPVPSEAIGRVDRTIDATLCYCVAGILSQGWMYHFRWTRTRLFSDEYLRDYAGLLVRLGIAWDFILAGDIDDLAADTEMHFDASQGVSEGSNCP